MPATESASNVLLPSNTTSAASELVRRMTDSSCQTDDVDMYCERCDCRCNCRTNTQTPTQTQTHISSQQSLHTNSQLTADSQTSDRTYNPDNDKDMDTDCDNMTEQTDNQPVEAMAKYLVFEEQLDRLFKFCPDCQSCITSTEKRITGTALTVSYTCHLGHNNIWHSQPYIRLMPVGNLLLSAAILLSGSTYAKTIQMANMLHMPILSKSEFYRIQNTYLIPTINDYWLMHQTAIMSILSSENLRLCGDARSDSPGFCSKYSSYSIMDMETSLIIDQQLISIADDKVDSSVAMEKEALERSLDFIISSGLKIHTLATDRHTGVQSLMKQNYPEINHQFDVWHFAKNITKKLRRKSQKKEATELIPWIRCINNHLYYSSQTCCGDPQLLKEK
jgi:hypothetical protein